MLLFGSTKCRRYCLEPVSNCSYFISELVHDKCVAGDVALVAGEQTLYTNKHCAVCNEENILGCGPRLLDVSGENSPVQVADFYQISIQQLFC